MSLLEEKKSWNTYRPLRFLFLDLNAYFASVEQDVRSELFGKPVGVVPVLSESSVLISASYEAKKYGIGTGTRVSEAIAKCPKISLVAARPPIYVHYHKRILEVLEDVLPIHKVCSIDEMSFMLLGDEMNPQYATIIGNQMKKILAEKIGPAIKCNIGIAPNTFLAKIASNMNKPDGLTIMHWNKLYEMLLPLKLTDYTGINKRMEQRLIRSGIYSSKHLLQATALELRTAFGSIIGERWWHLLRGYEVSIPPTKRTTLGHSHVLPPEFRTENGSKEVLIRLIQKASARLRYENFWCRGMMVYVKGKGLSWKQKVSMNPTQDTSHFIDIFLDMWRGAEFKNPVLVGVTFFNLFKPEQVTLNLFENNTNTIELSHAVDSMNKKYGKNRVFLASMQRSRDTAQEKIAFQKTTLFAE